MTKSKDADHRPCIDQNVQQLVRMDIGQSGAGSQTHFDRRSDGRIRLGDMKLPGNGIDLQFEPTLVVDPQYHVGAEFYRFRTRSTSV